MTLFRATAKPSDAETIPSGTCWTPDLGTAEAYTDNQGYGGEHIVSAEVAGDNAVDVRGCDARDLRPLARLLDADAQDWRDDGLDSVFAVLEERPRLWEALRAMGDWIIYLDDYPANAVTWRKL